jgi:hypothetical protein
VDLSVEHVAKSRRKLIGQAGFEKNVVAGTLQKAGLIQYRHGHVTIVDRENLESASCECYRAATDLLESVTDDRVR